MTAASRFWLILAATVVLVVIVVGGAGGDGPPLDPRSVNPDGAKGVVDVLESLGVEVELDRAVPSADSTAALLLDDRLISEDRDALRRWVSRGGVLVVADDRGSLAPPRVAPQQGELERGVCTIAALNGAELVPADGWTLRVDPGTDSCFGTGLDAFITSRAEGTGYIVNVGGPLLFTNAVLDDSDAAVVAVSLLAPDPASARVTFVGASVVDFGDESLNDLIAPRVRNSIMQVLAAFLIYALYRMRRLGGVVREPLPVRIEGSELILQAGRLSERAADPASAAAIVRRDFIDRAARALAIGRTDHSDADGGLLITVVAEKTGVEPSIVTEALHSRVLSEPDFVAVSRQIADLDARLFGRPLEHLTSNGIDND